MDTFVTQEKLDQLERELDRAKKKRPSLAAEVSRLAELGDFSENVEYQLAKGRLRGLNNAILKIEQQIKQATIIEPAKNTETVQIGHTVVVVDEKDVERTFQILGSAETNPRSGVISHVSPLGAALIGRKVGDKISIQLKNTLAEYAVKEIR